MPTSVSFPSLRVARPCGRRARAFMLLGFSLSWFSTSALALDCSRVNARMADALASGSAQQMAQVQADLLRCNGIDATQVTPTPRPAASRRVPRSGACRDLLSRARAIRRYNGAPSRAEVMAALPVRAGEMAGALWQIWDWNGEQLVEEYLVAHLRPLPGDVGKYGGVFVVGWNDEGAKTFSRLPPVPGFEQVERPYWKGVLPRSIVIIERSPRQFGISGGQGTGLFNQNVGDGSIPLGNDPYADGCKRAKIGIGYGVVQPEDRRILASRRQARNKTPSLGGVLAGSETPAWLQAQAARVDAETRLLNRRIERVDNPAITEERMMYTDGIRNGKCAVVLNICL